MSDVRSNVHLRSRGPGLPTSPRSRSTVRSGQSQPLAAHTNPPPFPRQIRLQKSLNNVTHDRSQSQPSTLPAPELPSRRALHTLSFDERGDPYSHATARDASSSSSLPLNRGRDLAPADRHHNPNDRQHWDGSISDEGYGSYTTSSSQSELPNDGYGYTIWNRVATVANSLTLSVSKAWATNVTTFSGEETPPGQESRLTRAMKAYHLQQARSREDLPEWLFDEQDRRPQKVVQNSVELAAADHDYRPPSMEQKRPKGLRDIFDAAAAVPHASLVHDPPSARRARDNITQPSKTTDRLKAIRDAKRGAFGVVTQNTTPSVGYDSEGQARFAVKEDADSPPTTRVGLPPRPRWT